MRLRLRRLTSRSRSVVCVCIWREWLPRCLVVISRGKPDLTSKVRDVVGPGYLYEEVVSVLRIES